MYKLLALDIDDTLTNISRVVPPENLAAIRRAQEAGVYVTYATGRGYFGAESIRRQIGMKGPAINYGGALIYDTRTDEPMFCTSLPPELVHELLLLADELGVHAQLYQGDGIVYREENRWSTRYWSNLDLPHTVDPNILEKRWENVPKVLFITEAEHVAELLPQLMERFKGRAKVSGSLANYIEFNDPFAHKGSATAWVANYLGIDRSEVCAVGDNLLDLEMIEWAGLGAAVANGNPIVKEKADIVIPACEENGVAWLIDNIILR